MRFIFVLFLLAYLAGCSIPPKINNVSPPRRFEKLVQHEVTDNSGRREEDGYDTPLFLSCDLISYKGKYEGDIDLAKESFPFALMASNAYRVEAQFEIPHWKFISHYRGDWSGVYEVGFQADVYGKYQGGEVVELAIAFRGTDNTADRHANFAIWWPWSHQRQPSQYQIADLLTKKIIKLYPGVKLHFVGHSLGGGLAYHASWKIPQANVYAFDPSPRVFVSGDPTPGRRVILREKGEIMELVQFWNRLPADAQSRYDFVAGNAIREHNMYYLARGILLLSAMYGNEDAKEAMRINMGCEK